MPHPAALILALLSLLLLVPTGAAAEERRPFSMVGSGVAGEVFNIGKLRGRVVMVFYWSTDCAVCRDKLPELRQNLRGWKDKPFELVTVSLDRKEADWRNYERLQSLTQAQTVQRSHSLWAGAPGFRHSLEGRAPRLPLTLVLDGEGRVVQRVEGRMAPELWDEVAALLP